MKVPSKWTQRKNKNAYRKTHPECRVCDRKPRWFQKKNEIHRIIPFSVSPIRGADQRNMITLCRACHFWIGHPKGWKSWNANITKSIIFIRKAYRLNVKVKH